MERCIIMVSVPQNTTGPSGSKSRYGGYETGAYELIGDTSVVQVWQIGPSAEALHAPSLTYNKLSRNMLLSSLYVAPGVDSRTREFPCSANSIQIFEFSCAWKNCGLSWYQESHYESPGKALNELWNFNEIY
jgi:hypothetical protein